MTQALYAHVNNKIKKNANEKKKTYHTSFIYFFIILEILGC
jgi:hypothetical protein